MAKGSRSGQAPGAWPGALIGDPVPTKGTAEGRAAEDEEVLHVAPRQVPACKEAADEATEDAAKVDEEQEEPREDAQHTQEP
eukprot:14210726-Alexandrium_andersonii.AAC.1